MDDDSNLPNKDDVAKILLQKGSMFLHLDPRKKGVVVPEWLKNQYQLVLQIGYSMPVPIPDLVIDDKGIFATLSFNRTPHVCSLPWDSMFALIGEDGRGMVWPNDIPSEIAAEVERESQRNKPKKQPPSQPNSTHSDPTVPTDRNSLDKIKKYGRDGSSRDGSNEDVLGIETLNKKSQSPPLLETIPNAPESNPFDESQMASHSKSLSESNKFRVGNSSSANSKKKRKTRKLPPYMRVIK